MSSTDTTRAIFNTTRDEVNAAIRHQLMKASGLLDIVCMSAGVPSLDAHTMKEPLVAISSMLIASGVRLPNNVRDLLNRAIAVSRSKKPITISFDLEDGPHATLVIS